ncbi:MAG: tyrosinase family protein [Nitrosospira sp.]
MALGDGIRRNIATVSDEERARFRDAIIALNSRFFPGDRGDFPAGHVSYWFKQDEIHQATHVHGGPAFMPWHREICNRFEAMLREVDPDLSLHYWDWNTDPAPLFNSSFMGNANGDAGDPWLSAGFYDPNVAGDNFRDNSIHGLNQSPPSYPQHANPADPPKNLTRNKQAGAPPVGQNVGGSFWPSDSDIVGAVTFQAFNNLIQGCEMGTSNNCAHGMAHSYIGGTIGNAHTSFRDPFVFLLHSNVDRLWAMWQTQPGHLDRLAPAHVYGDALDSDPEIKKNLQPWAGEDNWMATGGWPVRPWYTPENQQFKKDSRHPSVVQPPCYDTLPTYPARVTLETVGASINFNDVPTGETAARAIVFSAVSCHEVNLSITAGPTVLTGPAGTSFGTFPPPLGTSVSIPHISSSTPPIGRLWISYKGTNPLDTATGTVTVHCTETNEDFVIPITANTIARPTVAVMLVLDQSGSMDELAGIDPTTKRIDILHQAATQFVQIAQDSSRVGDGVGIVSFDQDAHPGIAVTKNMATGLDLGPVITAIQNLHPAGATSIGNGVALGRDNLNPVTGYDQKAMVVFTDGLENRPLYIADVMGSINDRTFAIGLGTAQQVSVGALTALANNTGGYLLLSGRLSPSIDDFFRLSKFFMQILAGVTNTNIVTDPSGFVAPGMKVRIPFVLNDTDIESTVILLTDGPGVRFLIETPAGDIMDPVQAGTIGATYAVGTNMNYYRFTLPLPLGANPAQEGTWYALLEVDDIIIAARRQISPLRAAQAIHGVRYNLSVQSYSNLRMQAGLLQNSLEPGATLTVRAALSEYGIPVDHRASARAELERPDNSKTTLTLAEVEPGIFEASTPAAIQGVYRFRLIASGPTMRGIPFTREQLLSGAVVLGGNNPPPTTIPGTGNQLCDLVECLLKPEIVGHFLMEHEGFMMEHKIDPGRVRDCIEKWCKQQRGSLSEEELRQLEGTSPASE